MAANDSPSGVGVTWARLVTPAADVLIRDVQVVEGRRPGGGREFVAMWGGGLLLLAD